jgi:hypothetical protein
MEDLGKLLKITNEHGIYSNWQGSIHALEQLKTHINFEIKRYKELQSSTDMGKTLDKVSNIGPTHE